MTIDILGGRVLLESGAIEETALTLDGGTIARLGGPGRAATAWRADGLLVLPGIVDLHGDAFERQLMPRPGVHFPHVAALMETDRQMVANGITTAFHGLTYSWEPGLRGAQAARRFVDALAAVRPRLACDTRLHLRHETYNLDAEAEVADWLASGIVDLLAFNDHMDDVLAGIARSEKLAVYAGRSGLDAADFRLLAHRIATRASAVPPSIERLAAVARSHGVTMASHDDPDPRTRAAFRALGSRICEFPVDLATARAAAEGGDAVIMGAPNVMRGGSHCGRLSAAEAVGEGIGQDGNGQTGLGMALTSDYHYPTLIQAAFKLAADGVVPLATAWSLVSANPAAAVGLDDRGRIAEGMRGDLLLVDDSDPSLPRVVASFVAGRAVHVAGDPMTLCRPVTSGGVAPAA